MRHLPDYQTLYRWSDSLFSYTFPLKLLGGHYGRRMIVCRSSDGQVLLISPLPLPPSLQEELGQLGTLAGLVFPTRFHDTGLAGLKPLMQTTPVYACPGFEKQLPMSQAIDELPAPWKDLLRWRRLEGMPKVNETVFYDLESRSLLPADLLFKFTPAFSRWTRLLARTMGTYPELQPTRLFLALVKDRSRFQTSLDGILQWDFQRILPAHAEVIDGPEGRAAIEAAARSR